MQRFLLALLALSLSGCGGDGDVGLAVRISMILDGSISDGDVDRIRTLEFQVQGSVETWYARIPVKDQFSGRKAKIIYRPRATSGSLDFQLAVRAVDDHRLGVGEVAADLKAGATVDVSVVIAAPAAIPGDGGMNAVPDLTVSPDLTVIDLAKMPPPVDMTVVTVKDLVMPPHPDMAVAAPDMSAAPQDMSMVKPPQDLLSGGDM